MEIPIIPEGYITRRLVLPQRLFIGILNEHPQTLKFEIEDKMDELKKEQDLRLL